MKILTINRRKKGLKNIALPSEELSENINFKILLHSDGHVPSISISTICKINSFTRVLCNQVLITLSSLCGNESA